MSRMKIAVMKIGGKAQGTENTFTSINEQVMADYVRQGYKVVLLPSAMGNKTDELLDTAKEKGPHSGEDLSHYLLHDGEEESGALYHEFLDKNGAKTILLRPEEGGFFLCGNFCDEPYDNRGMEFVTDGEAYLNCRPDIDASLKGCESFLRTLYDHDITIMTAWAVKVNGKIGLIKGRGGSDGSLVAVSEVLLRAGQDVKASTKITDVDCIRDCDGDRIENTTAADLIHILEGQGSWPVQRYALEQMKDSDLVLGVSPWQDIDRIGTYILGRQKKI